MRAAELDLDLDVFAGPFDLLMAVVLREEVSLAEVPLGDVVIAYLEHLEELGRARPRRRHRVPGPDRLAARAEVPPAACPRRRRISRSSAPEEAADELLARMLEYRRYRDAAAHLSEPVRGRARATCTAPRRCRRSCAAPRSTPPPRCMSRRTLAEALGALLRVPPEPDTSHIRPDRLARAPTRDPARAALARRGSFDFDEVFAREDRLTQAVTLFALLEMHKRGEASWEQRELFGPIEVSAA